MSNLSDSEITDILERLLELLKPKKKKFSLSITVGPVSQIPHRSLQIIVGPTSEIPSKHHSDQA